MGAKNSLFCFVDFEGKHIWKVPILMGLSFYLRAVYYFGFTRLEQMGIGNMILMLILPTLLELAFVVLMRGIRFNLPIVYGGLGAAYCLVLIVQSFQSGSVLRIVLSLIAYLACAALLVLVVLKILNKWFAVGAFLAASVGRFVIFGLFGYLFKLRFIAFIPEAAAICSLLALAILSWNLKFTGTRLK